MGLSSQVELLLEQTDSPIVQFTANGAYDGKTAHAAITSQSAGAASQFAV